MTFTAHVTYNKLLHFALGRDLSAVPELVADGAPWEDGCLHEQGPDPALAPLPQWHLVRPLVLQERARGEADTAYKPTWEAICAC